MTPRLLVLSALTLLLLIAPLAAQQADNGIAPYCEPLKDFPAKTLSSQILRTLLTESNNGVDPTQYSVGQGAAAEARGFEADLNGDKVPEMILLQHGGPADAGSNTLFLVREEANKSYKLLDVFNVTPGIGMILPIRLLPKGIQVYSQSTYKREDGSTESKAAFFTSENDALLALISWVNKDGTVNGKRVVTSTQAALSDYDYHGVKELFLKISTFEPGAGRPNDDNLTDQHVLTFQFLATQYRFTLYDSSGYDKIKKSAELTSQGARMLSNEKTAEDGVMKLKDAVTMDPFNTDARLILGRYYLRTSKISDAERTFSQAIEMDPLTPESYAYLGDTYIKINDLQKTLDNYRKYLELKPDGREAKRLKMNIKQITVPKGRRK
jgi:tetratricopeptide (TPR) repeat protein